MVPKNAFIPATIATFAAFASGMGVCLFNLDTVGACIDVAHVWVDKFHAMGDQLLAWGFAIVKGVRH